MGPAGRGGSDAQCVGWGVGVVGGGEGGGGGGRGVGRGPVGLVLRVRGCGGCGGGGRWGGVLTLSSTVLTFSMCVFVC